MIHRICKCINIFNTNDTEFDDISYSDTIIYLPPITRGKVIKVYDGDTFTIASRLPHKGSPFYRYSVRLHGIDCPEIKGKTEDEKTFAQLAKTEMIDIVMDRIVELKNVKFDKYGRILADVHINGIHVNQHMIDRHLAVKYDGGTKCIPTSWRLYHQTGEV
jgi:endonuclease YncB( thermonuclease family)